MEERTQGMLIVKGTKDNTEEATQTTFAGVTLCFLFQELANLKNCTGNQFSLESNISMAPLYHNAYIWPGISLSRKEKLEGKKIYRLPTYTNAGQHKNHVNVKNIVVRLVQ